MENKVLQNKKVLFVSLIFFIIILIVIFIIPFFKTQENVLIIDNLDKYAPNIPTSQKDIIQRALYSYVTNQNKVNGLKSKLLYYGNVRDGSAQISSSNKVGVDVYSISFILDISELQYSYETQFYWIEKNDNNTEIDVGATTIYCLSKEDAIYPDFNCDQNPSITVKSDPLLSIDISVYEGCWLSPFESVESASGYGVTIFYHPSDEDYERGTINSSYNACINDAKNHLVSNGLDLNNYKIKSEIKYFYNY